jgi:tripartite-type tricarboxylate transporter receptor subunit TctC
VSRFRRLVLAAAACIAAVGLGAAPAAADEFYAGKSIQLLIGFSAGGGYDLYGRALAHYLGLHIPGRPQVIVQNMPGAGSLKLVNFLYNVAPRDGTVIGGFAPGIVAEPLLGHGEGAQFEATQFGWLGSMSQEVSVCALMASTGIATVDDMQNKPMVIGASGGGAESDVFPTLLRNMFHWPIRIVTGYPGGTEITLAMQRHEVDGRCGWSWTSLLARNKAMLTSREMNVTLEIALAADDDPLLSGVPLIMGLTTDPTLRAALKLIVSRQSIARPFAAPPGLPADHLALLRGAFDETMRDPDFLAEAQRLDLDVRPVGGDAVATLIREIYASSPEAIRIATDAIQSKP